MKFLKLAIALIAVVGLTLAAKDYGLYEVISHDFQEASDSLNHKLAKEKREKTPKTVFDIADSICQEVGVPFELIKEIGNNESGWRCIKNSNGGTDFGDLQVIDVTFKYWYDRLELTGGKTRRNYLVVGINYLKYNYKRYGSWRKARFAYGRGDWRDESTWTELEVKFMGKINWAKYDNPGYVKK